MYRVEMVRGIEGRYIVMLSTPSPNILPVVSVCEISPAIWTGCQITA